MINSVHNALAANPAVLSFALAPGPRPCVAGVLHAPMTAVAADAYVIPHSRLQSAVLGPRMEALQAGAEEGVRDYDRFVSCLDGTQLQWGDTFVASSGGGLSKYLIHVVASGSGRELRDEAEKERRLVGDVAQLAVNREMSTLEYAVFASLIEAGHRGIGSVVFPPMSSGMSGLLTAEQSARVMYGALYAYWQRESGNGPEKVFVAVPENGGSYRIFEGVMNDIFSNVPTVQNRPEEKATIVPRPETVFDGAKIRQEDAAPDMGMAMEILGKLSDLELASLVIVSSFNRGDLMDLCTSHPWFPKVAQLFAPDGSLINAAKEALKRESARR